jgi:amino acid transporter
MSQQDIPLARTLGLASATALGLGAMIGAGIFVLTGLGAAEAGRQCARQPLHTVHAGRLVGIDRCNGSDIYCL